MVLDKVQPEFDPVPNSPGVEGHGEGVRYKGELYFYRVGCKIPKNKSAALRSEGNYCGRVHGDVTYLVVVWNGESFTVLDEVWDGIQKEVRKYKGMSCQEAIEFVRCETEKCTKQLESLQL